MEVLGLPPVPPLDRVALAKAARGPVGRKMIKEDVAAVEIPAPLG